MFNKHCLIALFIFFIVVAGGVWLLPPYQEYRRTRGSLVLKRREVRQNQREKEKLREEILRLQTDDRAVERVARDKFSWCKPNEKVYDYGQQR